MRKGDISARPAPRLLFVWEGLIAHLPESEVKAWERERRKKRYAQGLKRWVTDSTMIAQMWRVAWNYDFGIDVVSYLDEGFENTLRVRLDAENAPVGNVLVTTPERLIREMPPNIGRVFDPDPSRVLHYGSIGRIVTDPYVFDPMV